MANIQIKYGFLFFLKIIFFFMLLFEPLRGVYIVVSWFAIMITSPILTKRIPILSDIFVFSYPLFLLCGYMYAAIREWKYLRKKPQNFMTQEIDKKTYFYNISKTFWIKSFLLNIFFVAVVSIGINIFIQQFFIKQRPYIFFSEQNQNYITDLFQKNNNNKKTNLLCFFMSCDFLSSKETSIRVFEGFYTLSTQKTHHQTLLHAFLPKTSFPSDHAVLSFAIAIGVIYGSLKTKKIKQTVSYDDRYSTFFVPFPSFLFFLFGIVFFVFAIIMGIGRIMSGVHRPTDIIAGAILGTGIGFLFFQKPIWFFFQKYLIIPIITYEQKIFWWCKKIIDKFFVR